MRWIAIIVIALTFANCAMFGTQTTRKKVKDPKGETVTLEVKKPQDGNTVNVNTPQRTASLQIVSQGKGLLEQGLLDRALQAFQEAATIDGSNGIAYYYLARTHYAMLNFEQALGLLDRAAALLGNVEGWNMSIEALREAIRIAQTQPPSTA